jgi:hypothetical protein
MGCLQLLIGFVLCVARAVFAQAEAFDIAPACLCRMLRIVRPPFVNVVAVKNDQIRVCCSNMACGGNSPNSQCWHEARAALQLLILSASGVVRVRPTGPMASPCIKRYQYQRPGLRPIATARCLASSGNAVISPFAAIWRNCSSSAISQITFSGMPSGTGSTDRPASGSRE